MVSLVDELLLLAYDDRTGRNRAQHLDVGLGGAIMLELTMADRIEVIGGRVQVTDPTPTGDRVLDGALRGLGRDKPRKPTAVVQRAGKGVKQALLDGLVRRGVMRFEAQKVFGLFRLNRYLPNNPAAEADARARLTAAVDRGAASDARTAALAALVYALQMHRLVFPDRKQREVRKALKAIAEGSWAGDATRKAVEAAQAAVMAAVVTATAASTVSAGIGG